jgi:4-amino-4-deoxy-L-arabinose transferase-like glycosyltransferase
MGERPFARAPLVALGLLFVSLWGLNSFWLSLNTIPPHWDTANHMVSALKYRSVLSQCLAQPFFSFQSLKHCLGEIVYVDQFVYPPLFPLAGGAISFLVGTSITALAMTNVLFAGVLVAAMYFMGCAIHSRLTGVLAAVLSVAYPFVYQTSREFMLEFALVALTAAAGCFLLLSDRFRHTTMTLLFGLTIGLGALTKFTFLTYLIGPATYVLARLVIDTAQGRVDAHEAARRLLTLASALAIGFIVAAMWYWPHRVDFLNALRGVAALDTIGSSVFSPASLTYYLNALISAQMGPPLFVVFLFGLWRVGFLVNAEWRNVLLVWMASIYAIQTAVSHKGIHDDIGILVPAALISAFGIASLARYRSLALGAVGCIITLQIAILTLPEPALGARVGTFGWAGVVTPYPRTEHWRVEDVLHGLTPSARVAVVSDHMFINGTTLQYYAMKDHLPLQVQPCWRLNVESTHADFSAFDVIVAKSDDDWIKPKLDGCFKGPNGRSQYAALLRRLGDHSAGFHLSRGVGLPDGSTLLVFGADLP